MNRLTSHISVLLSCSVLESDPEFGFEEAKRQLEGIQESPRLFVFTSFDVFLRNNVCHVLFPRRAAVARRFLRPVVGETEG